MAVPIGGGADLLSAHSTVSTRVRGSSIGSYSPVRGL